MSFSFGLLWTFRNPPFARVPWDQLYREQLELIAESEALGFEHAWLSEHHFVDDGYSPSVLTIASAVAARTSRLRIGTFLLLLPLHHPVRVAEDAATVDQISGGRLDLGVGQGYRLGEFEDQGIPHGRRGARLEEGLGIVRDLLAGETVTVDGEFTALRGIRIVPPALQRPRPPIWVGGVADKAIDRIARMGFHFLNGGQADRAKAYDDALRRHGRDPADFDIAAGRMVYVAPSREQAWEIAARPLHHIAQCYLDWYREAGDTPDYEALKITVPSVEEIKEAQEFDFFGERATVGTPADVIRQIEDYRASARVTHFAATLAMPGMSAADVRGGMRLFAAEVMPHFRD
jgi:alkanesulfonate monooxygenase SsuD/methylene tetrahydromethanopterin reductase-like flavin-dependent oxidoreductase (luciferase family)